MDVRLSVKSVIALYNGRFWNEASMAVSSARRTVCAPLVLMVSVSACGSSYSPAPHPSSFFFNRQCRCCVLWGILMVVMLCRLELFHCM